MYGNQNKAIGWMVIAILSYYVLQVILPFLIWGLVGLVVWQIYWAYRRGR